MFRKFRVKQLRQWVFFGATGHWHLGTLWKLHTKHWFDLNSEYAAPIWHPYQDTQIAQVQRTAARLTCRRWRNTSSVGDMLDELEWPSLEARKEQSSLTFFYKIHSGTVSLDKDKYLTSNIRSTRASREFQYDRYLAYSEALKNSFFPRTIPVWNSLPPSVASSKTPEEFKALI